MEEPPTIDALRIHLVDDHTIFREGLEAILSSREDVEVVGRSSTGEETLPGSGRPNSTSSSPSSTCRSRAHRRYSRGCERPPPHSRIVVLTMQDGLHYLKALSRMGIDAYLHKTSSREDLMATIDALSRQASPGGQNPVISVPRGLIERLEEEPEGGLSERETEIPVLAASPTAR